MMDRSESPATESPTDGNAVLSAALEAAKERLGANLSAAFALGSLAHGGFAPLVSDVDLAVVLGHLDDAASAAIAGIGPVVRERHPASALAARLSVFWGDWESVRRGAGAGGRLPELDRLDLLGSGVLLYGEDRRDGAMRPSKDSLVRQAAEFTLGKFDPAYLASLRDPATLVASGPRPVTKAVLFPVRFRYTLHTGRIGRNDDAAHWHDGDGRELVSAAMRWRLDGIHEANAAARLLERDLLGLYRRFAAEYVDALEAMGEDGIADRLGGWAAALR